MKNFLKKSAKPAKRALCHAMLTIDPNNLSASKIENFEGELTFGELADVLHMLRDALVVKIAQQSMPSSTGKK